MKFTKLFAPIIAAFALLSGALADGHDGDPAVNARQAHMKLYSFNLDVIGAMVKGEVDYNADAAQAAADNLMALAAMNQSAYWVPGTWTVELDGTKAKPEIWDEGSRFEELGDQLIEAADQLAAVAVDGQDALRGAIRGVGGACSACHRNYRQR